MSRPRSEITTELHELGIIIDRREIFLGRDNHDIDIDTTDFRSAMKFIKNMRLLQKFGEQKNNPIIIHQMNEGGDWFAGMAIYDAIASSESHVTVVCHGAAMSMGSIIPQAADLRIMMPNSVFMIHAGEGGMMGTFKQGISWSDFNKQSYKKMLDIYVEKCKHGIRFKGKTESAIKKELEKQMDKKEDWILTSKEAVEYGFADVVLGQEGYETINKILNKI